MTVGSPEGRRPAVDLSAGSETLAEQRMTVGSPEGRRPAVDLSAGSETRAEQRMTVGRPEGRRPAVDLSAGSETRRTEDDGGEARGEETSGQSLGGVGDPRRTEGDGGEARGEETCGQALDGVGDPRRTENFVVAKSPDLVTGGTEGLPAPVASRAEDLRSNARQGQRPAPNGAGSAVGCRHDLREAIDFGDAEWNVPSIQARFRAAVDAFRPDFVVVTDTWNMKPHLAEAMRGYPTYLMIQAQECLCPLNNLRLIGLGPAQVEQCPRNQLATPETCRACIAERGHHSGALHQHERALAGVGSPSYDQRLRRSFLEAEAVLVLNPITAAMLEPHAKRVCIVPWGLDAARFPWAEEPDQPGRPSVTTGAESVRLFMAAVAGEFIKGFHIAHEACRLLRQSRDDFELVVTFDPPGPGKIDEFTRSVGWCSQEALPRHYREADICLVPTIAQDGLSITSVEAMASGVPVIGSRIGGLPYTVTDGVTGLLFESGNPTDLAAKIGRLLDDPALRRRMGLAGRKRFEEDFTWDVVIERYWKPLLSRSGFPA